MYLQGIPEKMSIFEKGSLMMNGHFSGTPGSVFVRTDESEDRPSNTTCNSLERFRVTHLEWISCIPSVEAWRVRYTNIMLKSLEEKNIERYQWRLALLNLLEV